MLHIKFAFDWPSCFRGDVLILWRNTEKRLSTFAVFIDLTKAYDSIQRRLLWDKLSDIGIGGKISRAIKSMYANVQSCVRINGICTDFFEVNLGLKQGCLLSPLLFNFYINDLVDNLKFLDLGVNIDGEKVSVLLYADDIVLLSENENDMQRLLDVISEWCNDNKIHISRDKSKVVHFRNPSTPLSRYIFHCDNNQLDFAPSYQYLGLLFTEHLDYDIMAKTVAQSASRALGLLIAKCKQAGGFAYSTFTKLYDSLVWSVIDYGASIWGFTEYSCINAVHHRACRFFMGVGKYTPNAAVNGDMAWIPTIVRQWKAIGRLWTRLIHMDNTRLNKRVFLWSNTASNSNVKNWPYKVKEKLAVLELSHFSNPDNMYSFKHVLSNINEKCMNLYKQKWRALVNNQNATRGQGRNKLRTYSKFKDEYKCEPYLMQSIPKSHRRALAKFRCGVAPIRIETGRFERLNEEDRVCAHCNVVENEKHVLIDCPFYQDIRFELFESCKLACNEFETFNADDQLNFILASQSVFKISAKTCFSILDRHRAFKYS